MTAPEWQIVAQTRDRLGESPMWHPAEQAIYWVDWYGPTIHRLKHGRDVESWPVPGTAIIGSLVFVTGGRLMLAVDSGLVLFDPAAGTFLAFADPNEGRENICFNDSKVDRSGRLWVGTCDGGETEPRGILYGVTREGRHHVADSGFAVSNGPAFSPDGTTLYFSDSAARRILAYDMSPDSLNLSNRRVFARFNAEDGMPDGLTVDAEGCLWVAHYGGGRVSRLAPDGRVVAVFPVPCPVVAAVCFGGPGMSTLFAATGWSPGVRSAQDEPGPGGGLLALETGIRGLAEPEFAPVEG